MANPVQQFVEMIRSVTLTLYCALCGRETVHYLTEETKLDEIYTCGTPNCGKTETYRVR